MPLDILTRRIDVFIFDKKRGESIANGLRWIFPNYFSSVFEMNIKRGGSVSHKQIDKPVRFASNRE